MQAYVGDYFIYTGDTGNTFTYIITQHNDKGDIWLSELHNGRLTPVGYESNTPDWPVLTVNKVINGVKNWRYVRSNPHLTLPVGA